MTTWFISDTHFWHYGIIEMCKRPIIGWKARSREEACNEMNTLLIKNWNSRINPEDQVYHLGDFAFAGTNKCDEIFSKLNGRKYLIRGNHDGKSQCKQEWEWVRDYSVLREQLTIETDEGEERQYTQPIILCHYPILSWDGMAHGAWHLHGHCHGSLPDNGSLRLDMGVDCNNYLPVSLMEVYNKMALRSIVPAGDHHK